MKNFTAASAALSSVLFLLGCAQRSQEILDQRDVAATDGRGSETEAWVCSFNIQWVGFSNSRDNQALADLLKKQDCEMVVVQEIIAPPSEEILLRNEDPDFRPTRHGRGLRFPTPGAGGRIDPIKPQPKTTEFFEAMAKVGYDKFVLSSEDTGPQKFHSNNSDTEWFAVFWRGDKIRYAPDLPKGFLATPLFKNRDYDRVPFAFPFRTSGGFDFVLVNVHLAANDNEAPRRVQEITAIENWIRTASRSGERDYIILGDMNIADADELKSFLPDRNWESLNEECLATNTSPREGKPYDHVVMDRRNTTIREIPSDLRSGRMGLKNFVVVDLLEELETAWRRKNPGRPYPGGSKRGSQREGYDHTVFRTAYSDHHPVKFRIALDVRDDDGRR